MQYDKPEGITTNRRAVIIAIAPASRASPRPALSELGRGMVVLRKRTTRLADRVVDWIVRRRTAAILDQLEPRLKRDIGITDEDVADLRRARPAKLRWRRHVNYLFAARPSSTLDRRG